MRRLAIIAVCFSLVPTLSWAESSSVLPDLGKTYNLLSGHIAGEGMGGEVVEVPAIKGVATAAGQNDATVKELEGAVVALNKTIAEIGAEIKNETDQARKIKLYEWRESVQAALSAVEKALSALAVDPERVKKEAELKEALDEAKFLNMLLGSYLGKGDFAGTFHFKKAAFEVEVDGGIVYENIRKRLPFLGGVVGGRFRVNPGAEMISQFNSLKAEYYTSLLTASQFISELGKTPSSNKLLKGMAEWGKETKVIYPGHDWMSAVQIITNFQYYDITR